MAPDDVDGFARSLVRVLTDDAFAADLIRRGYERATHFSWARTAAATVAVYRRVLGVGATAPIAEHMVEVVR